MSVKKDLAGNEPILTIVANHIVHLTGGSIAVLFAVNQESGSPNARDTTDSAQASRTTTDNNDIVVGLRDLDRADTSQQRDERRREGDFAEHHSEG